MNSAVFSNLMMKGLGIYCFLQIPLFLFQTILFITRPKMFQDLEGITYFLALTGALLPGILYLLIGSFLIFKLGRRPKVSESNETKEGIREVTLQSLLLGSIGIFLICEAIPDIGSMIYTRIYRIISNDIPDFDYNFYMLLTVVSLRLLLGTILLYFSFPFAKLLKKLRYNQNDVISKAPDESAS